MMIKLRVAYLLTVLGITSLLASCVTQKEYNVGIDTCTSLRKITEEKESK